MTNKKIKKQLAKIGTRMLFLEYISICQVERAYKSNLSEKGQYHQETLLYYGIRNHFYKSTL